MRLLLVAALIGGCSTAASPADGGADLPVAVDAAPPDLAPPPTLNGKFAVELSLSVALDADGGAQRAGLRLLATGAALEQPDGTAPTAWLLCDVPVPDLVDVPIELLDPVVGWSQAQATPFADGVRLAQPAVPFVVGARLADPLHDPLPADASRLCSQTVTSNCVVADPMTGQPGAAVDVTGLDPDVDRLYFDLRVIFAADFAYHFDDTVDGVVSSASIEAHVLGCRLRAGGPCAPADVARLEASHPRVTVTDGKLRGHGQGFYFTCPQLVADPEGSLAAMEAPLDGGTADGDVASPTFTSSIQADVDARGCATGGCHETFMAPGQLHLVYKPSPAEEQQNYQAILPWTIGPPPGGRFVNQVPLPSVMKARWLRWIAANTPY